MSTGARHRRVYDVYRKQILTGPLARREARKARDRLDKVLSQLDPVPVGMNLPQGRRCVLTTRKGAKKR